MTAEAPSGTGPRDGLDLRWLLDRLLVQVAGVDMAVLLSADGLLLTGSAGMPDETAEHLAATGSALIGLARSTGRQFGRGKMHQAAIEMDGGYLLVAAAGKGTGLAVLTAPDADIGLIVYEMHLLVRRVGSHMRVGSRPRGPSAAQA
jgi:predicted regulator of Ras-like GTPase activity (Roadblock/LC7/MglB family)